MTSSPLNLPVAPIHRVLPEMPPLPYHHLRQVPNLKVTSRVWISDNIRSLNDGVHDYKFLAGSIHVFILVDLFYQAVNLFNKSHGSWCLML